MSLPWGTAKMARQGDDRHRSSSLAFLQGSSCRKGKSDDEREPACRHIRCGRWSCFVDDRVQQPSRVARCCHTHCDRCINRHPRRECRSERRTRRSMRSACARMACRTSPTRSTADSSSRRHQDQTLTRARRSSQQPTRACKAYSPEDQAASGTVDPQLQAEALKYSACMRSHGVPSYPDPVFVGGSIRETVRAGSGMDPNSPQFIAAQQACQSLQPFARGDQVSSGVLPLVRRRARPGAAAREQACRWDRIGRRCDRRPRLVVDQRGRRCSAACVGQRTSALAVDGTSPVAGDVSRDSARSSPSPFVLPSPSPSASPFVASSGVGVQLNFSAPGSADRGARQGRRSRHEGAVAGDRRLNGGADCGDRRAGERSTRQSVRWRH